MKKKLGYLGLAVSVGLLASATVLTGAAPATDGLMHIESKIRPNDFMPAHHSQAAINAFAAGIDNAPGLEMITLNADLPEMMTTKVGEAFSKEQMNKIKFGFTGPYGGKVAAINSDESMLKVSATQAGQVMMHGYLSGTLQLKGTETPFTAGVVSIPEINKSHFAVTIFAHDGVEPLTMSFGNLDPTPELVEIAKQ